jgi:hydroxymethylbilane synthase
VSRLRIGTRGSTLALAQSSWVKRQIEEHAPEIQVELRTIRTSGDHFIDAPIKEIGGKGIFTKEIEEALTGGEIDLAVHSLKDLPTQLPAGLTLVAMPKREDARDVLISRSSATLADLAQNAKIGTGSLRRRAQLLAYRPDLHIAPVRGNIDTRLKKLDGGEFDALVLAAAGLRRIGRDNHITQFLPDEICVSAVAQGALGIEAREETDLRELLAFLHDAQTFAEVAAERAFADCLGSGCHVPIGARARVLGNELKMIAVVASLEGQKICRGEIVGHVSEAVELGQSLAGRLIGEGADKLLAPFGR